MSSDNYEYDVFISYSSKDKAWVRGELRPKLEDAGLAVCIDHRDFRIGVPSVREMERAVQESRHTLAVLTPAYLTSGWTEFENLMLQTLDAANRESRLIPLLYKECELPTRIGFLTFANFVSPEDEAAEWEKLLRALQTPEIEAPIPPRRPPCPADNPFTDIGRINDPAYFFPRSRTVREIQQTLTAGNSVSLVGESQIGKSSLLYYLYKTQGGWMPEHKAVYLNMQSVLDIDDFCQEVLREMGRNGQDLRALRDTLRNEPLLLFLDEVEDLAKPEFAGRLQDMLRALVEDGHLLMVVASCLPLAEVFPPSKHTSPLHNVFTTHTLGPLTEQQMNEFLDARLGDWTFLFSSDERQNLYQKTSGHPARVQRAAQALFMQKVNRS